jgi:hypothetical protein
MNDMEQIMCPESWPRPERLNWLFVAEIHRATGQKRCLLR